jgi:hypothetical protein
MTEEMKFWIARAAGVPCNKKEFIEDGVCKITLTTAYPVDVQILNGQLLVFSNPNLADKPT